MTDQVFNVTGNRIASLIIDDESLKFSSRRFDSLEAFQTAWNKKFAFGSKAEVNYGTIKSVRKEENDEKIIIRYKSFFGIYTDFEFSFVNADDYDAFFNYLTREKFFTKSKETLTPFKAIQNHLIGLIAIIVFTIFAYYQAVAIANGTTDATGDNKGSIFKYIAEMLGEKGVLVVGPLITLFLLYKIWKRYTNPPDQVLMLPPNT